MTFRAIRIDEKGQPARLVEMTDDELMDADVTIRVTHSTVNYKDGLVLSGKSAIVSRFPMVAGIDLAGVVESARHPDFRAGDEVLANGYALSQTAFGAGPSARQGALGGGRR